MSTSRVVWNTSQRRRCAERSERMLRQVSRALRRHIAEPQELVLEARAALRAYDGKNSFLLHLQREPQTWAASWAPTLRLASAILTILDEEQWGHETPENC